MEYYRTNLPEKITNAAWERLLSSGSGINGLCALNEENALIGLVHYIFHPVTWAAGSRCYLEDLFTSKKARGKVYQAYSQCLFQGFIADHRA
ncbi:MAG: hypothetical protein V3U57_09565 [Robiginitomaculum sp.]